MLKVQVSEGEDYKVFQGSLPNPWAFRAWDCEEEKQSTGTFQAGIKSKNGA